MAARFTQLDYRTALQALLPTGLVWPREEGATLTQTLHGLAGAFERADGAAVALIADAFPAAPVQLLAEWEATLGLPDPCAGPAPTLQQRQAQVLARLTDTGGQSAADLINFAARLGFDIRIRNYATFRAGRSHAGDPCCGPAWAHAFAVIAPAQTTIPFRAGHSTAGEPLRAWGNATLECEIRRIAPAHAVVIFQYGGEGSEGLLDEFGGEILDEDGEAITGE